MVTADTASGPYAGASGGSKVTYTVGAAVLRAVLATGLDPDARDRCGRTPLMYAVSSADGPQMVALLLEAGVKVNAEDESGDTPLTLAAWCAPAETVQMLLSAGADAHHANAAGNTPLDEARFCMNSEVVRLLAEAMQVRGQESEPATDAVTP